ncbi:hypothetical protein ACWDBF_35625 [Streptomyces angustmyceticus]
MAASGADGEGGLPGDGADAGVLPVGDVGVVPGDDEGAVSAAGTGAADRMLRAVAAGAWCVVVPAVVVWCAVVLGVPVMVWIAPVVPGP